MSIIGTLPNNIKNGDLEDAITLMANFNWIVAQVNANSAPLAGALPGVTSINGGPLAGTRNRLINGDLRVNQRVVTGTVTLAAGVYGHDRWKAGAGGCTYTFAASGNRTIITITAGTLIQVVEAPNIEGGVYRLSHLGTAQARFGVSGAAPSGSYAPANFVNALISSAATGGATLSIEFSTGTLDSAQVEFGTVATPFEQRLVGEELYLCQRYLPVWVIKTSYYQYSGQCFSATDGRVFLPSPAPTRVAPTNISLNPFGVIQISTSNGSLTGTGTLTFFSGSTTGILVAATGATGLVAGNSTMLAATATDSTIFGTGCEL